MDAKTLLEKAASGFDTLEIADKYRKSALKWLKAWLSEAAFAAYRPQIAYLITAGKWEFLLDAFYQVIPFGTGGRRGLVGIGPNRINPWTIQASAQGHSQYLIRRHGDDARRRGVVLAFDVRKYTQKGVYDDNLPNPVMNLDGRRLAEAAAGVYAANGIRVYMFETCRSTPELSFAIRHLHAVSGDVFSASHNLPTDNGKKVYDSHGGQLIPPEDQALVDEVTENVSDIQVMDFEKARADGLIAFVGQDLDNSYHEAAMAVSLSPQRALRIVYSPLHGTGLTSTYPVLQKLGFDVVLDPETANLSGAFENVTFNIPNPEVLESFDASLPFAKKSGADILISTDPDADRIGVMLDHHGRWEFLSGNEIGVILTDYALSKYREKGRLKPQNTVIKTDVTTSLIEKIARRNGVACIGRLLVGFKYIAAEMNRLEDAGRIDDFILGTEESHGFLMGNYARDKDAACAAVWICEHAAELKKRGLTLLDDLNRIYAQYGYCHNYLTEIRLLGAKGLEQIAHIMAHLRGSEIEKFGDFEVKERIDRWQGPPQPHLSKTDTAARNVLVYYFADLPDTDGLKVTVRPSGTEPKIKMYFEVVGRPCEQADLEAARERITGIRKALEKCFMQYCYRLLDIDFPERGFLLFWQLPLADKLKYFEIEDDLARLKDVADAKRRQREAERLLKFLGANPVEKVDGAFRARFGAGIRAYLALDAAS